MASFKALPYELKLHIAKDLIDLYLAQAATFIPGFQISEAPLRTRSQHAPTAKLQIGSLLEVAPDLGRDLFLYCRMCSQTEVPFDRGQSFMERSVEIFKNSARVIMAKALAETIEEYLSSDASVVA